MKTISWDIFFFYSSTPCRWRQHTWYHVHLLILFQHCDDQKADFMLTGSKRLYTCILTQLLRTSTVITHKVEFYELWLEKFNETEHTLFDWEHACNRLCLNKNDDIWKHLQFFHRTFSVMFTDGLVKNTFQLLMFQAWRVASTWITRHWPRWWEGF